MRTDEIVIQVGKALVQLARFRVCDHQQHVLRAFQAQPRHCSLVAHF